MAVSQKSKSPQLSGNINQQDADSNEISEKYLNHPTWGLLYRVCLFGDSQELFATIYAMRLFFLVTTTDASVKCESIGRNDARQMMEDYLRLLRRNGQDQKYKQVQAIYKTIFYH